MDNIKNKVTINKSLAYRIVFLCVAVLIVYVVYTYSFVEVSVSEEGTNDYTVRIVHDEDGSTREEDLRSSSKTFLLKRGGYSISVRSDTGSYFANVVSPGFLRTNTYSAELQPELARDFVAIEPLSCMNYGAGTVFSWVCNEVVDSGVMHVAGDRSQPPTTDGLVGYGGTVINSSFLYNNELFVIARSSAESESGEAIHAVYPLTTEGRLDISNGKVLRKLSRSGSYYAREYRDGFLVFNRSGSTVFYYSSPYEEPVELTADLPDDQDLTLQDVSTRGDNYVMAYSQPDIPAFIRGNNYRAPQYVSDDRPENTDSGSSEVFIYGNDSGNYQLDFDFPLSQARLCGDGLLCLNRSGSLVIYSLNDGEANLLHEFSDVSQIETYNDRILAVFSDGIASIDPSLGVGYYSYTLGSYTFCGVEVVSNSSEFIGCIEDQSGKSYALLFSGSNLAGTAIDKVVAELSRSDLTASVSPYKSYVHVLGEYGDPVQREAGFFINRENISTVNQSLRELAESNGLSASDYQLIFTLD